MKLSRWMGVNTHTHTHPPTHQHTHTHTHTHDLTSKRQTLEALQMLLSLFIVAIFIHIRYKFYLRENTNVLEVAVFT